MTSATPPSRDEAVVLLAVGHDSKRLSESEIEVPAWIAGRLTPGRRVLMSDDFTTTYRIASVTLQPDGSARLGVRRARPILCPDFVQRLFSEQT